MAHFIAGSNDKDAPQPNPNVGGVVPTLVPTSGGCRHSTETPSSIPHSDIDLRLYSRSLRTVTTVTFSLMAASPIVAM